MLAGCSAPVKTPRQCTPRAAASARAPVVVGACPARGVGVPYTESPRALHREKRCLAYPALAPGVIPKAGVPLPAPRRVISPSHRSMSDQTYDDGRARNLEELLRALADHIRLLDAEGRLLANPAELTRLVGDVKSELFHYEVRATYDTPEVADSRRIVNDAITQSEQEESWQRKGWTEDADDAQEW